MGNYGDILREHRQIRGLTLKDIEKSTGINNGSLSRWERDEVTPSIDYCVQLANYYGITLNELLGLDDFDKRPSVLMSAELPHYSADERKIVEQYRTLPEKLKKLIREQLEIYCAPSELLSKPTKKV